MPTPSSSPSAALTLCPADPPAGSDSPGPIPGLRRPPPVSVCADDVVAQLTAWTFCYGNGCADGFPPNSPPDLGAPAAVAIRFPLPDWQFSAEFVAVGDACPRRHLVETRRIDAHNFVLEPAGRAGTYDVTLFGRGNGDLFVTFRWTTPRAGPMPIPNARLAVLAGNDGVVDSYGVELGLYDMARTPAVARAQVTVTSANGRSLTFEPTRLEGCQGEGVVLWDGPDAAGRDAAGLGPAPFRYDVVVVLDGVAHRASAWWPADEIDENEPSVRLDFSPPLPALPASP
jgi:hypothetical protein